MDIKDIKELRAMDQKHLDKEEDKAKKQLNAITFEKGRGNLKDTSTIGKTKKYIAQLSSIATDRKKDAADKAIEVAEAK